MSLQRVGGKDTRLQILFRRLVRNGSKEFFRYGEWALDIPEEIV